MEHQKVAFCDDGKGETQHPQTPDSRSGEGASGKGRGVANREGHSWERDQHLYSVFQLELCFLLFFLLPPSTRFCFAFVLTPPQILSISKCAVISWYQDSDLKEDTHTLEALTWQREKGLLTLGVTWAQTGPYSVTSCLEYPGCVRRYTFLYLWVGSDYTDVTEG